MFLVPHYKTCFSAELSTMPESTFFNKNSFAFEIPHMFTFSQENSSDTEVCKFTFDTNSWKSFEVKCSMIGRDLDKLLHTIRSCYLSVHKSLCHLHVIMSMQFYLECYNVVFKMKFSRYFRGVLCGFCSLKNTHSCSCYLFCIYVS